MQNNKSYDIIIKNLTKEWYSSMSNKLQSNIWEIPKYSKKEINKAGQILSNEKITLEEHHQALTILNNWRSSHAYPLQVISSNLRRNNPNAIVVQRLKRLDSIIGKLKRFPEMNLYRMQDLGGCRVIVDSVEQVYKSLNKYKNSRIRHLLKREDDYIQNPKQSGYRSYHIIYQFHSDNKETYNRNMLIEIQFRTKLQHIWATAIEMMGIYTKNNLKSSQGDETILKFFTLVSSLFAMKENTPICPDTPCTTNELLNEIIRINDRNNIIIKLKAINQAVQETQYNENFFIKNGYYLLVLNYDEPSLNIYSFKQLELELASNIYAEMEYKSPSTIDIVLVSAKSFDISKTAYPNYFIDIREFINVLENIFSTYNYTFQNTIIPMG